MDRSLRIARLSDNLHIACSRQVHPPPNIVDPDQSLFWVRAVPTQHRSLWLIKRCSSSYLGFVSAAAYPIDCGWIPDGEQRRTGYCVRGRLSLYSQMVATQRFDSLTSFHPADFTCTWPHGRCIERTSRGSRLTSFEVNADIRVHDERSIDHVADIAA